jgi:signal transduction histidine kinase
MPRGLGVKRLTQIAAAIAVACLFNPGTLSARTMGNALRLFVFLLALTAVGATAALTQIWVNHRALTRQHASDEPTDPIALRAFQRDQQNAVGLIVTVSLLSLLAVALMGGTRPATSIGETTQQARQEMHQVEHLAKTNVAQEAALSLERAERRRVDENLHLQQLLLNEVLAEKIRLGRDLHDGVIQSLYATGLTLESARQKQAVDPAAADVLFDRGIELLNQSIREIRGYIQPPSESPGGMPLSFTKAVDVLVADLKGDRDVSFLVRIDESAESLLAASQLADTLQIVREAVSNALRHGAASEIQIRLHEEGDQLALMIQDNGAGFDATGTGAGGGNGLTNFRARAATLGAVLKLDSRPSHGTRVVLTIPTLNHS